TRVFHRRIEAAAEAARAHAELDTLADAPVLAVHDVPEIHGVAWVETRLANFRLMEQELAGNARVVRGHGPERKGGNVFGRGREQEVWIDDLALVVRLLRFRQAREWRARR